MKSVAPPNLAYACDLALVILAWCFILLALSLSGLGSLAFGALVKSLRGND